MAGVAVCAHCAKLPRGGVSTMQAEKGGCLLLATDVRPQPEPQLADFTTPDSFFSFQAGYIKGDAAAGASRQL